MSSLNRRAMHDALAKRFGPTADSDAAHTDAAVENAAVGPNEASVPGQAPKAVATGPSVAAGNTPPVDAPSAGAPPAGNDPEGNGDDGGIGGFISSLFDFDTTISPIIPTLPTTSAVITPVVKPSSVITTKAALTTSSSSIVTSSSSSLSSSPSIVKTSSSSVITTSSAQRQTSTITGKASVETVLTEITSSATSSKNTLSAGEANASAPSTTPSGSSSMSSGEMTGAIVAVVVVLIVAIGGAFYFIRKCRSRQDEEDNFDPNAFRANAIALPEDTPSPMARVPSRSTGSPRPPTMIERKYNNIASAPRQPMYPGQAMYPGQGMYPGQEQYGAYGQTNGYNDFNAQQASFAQQPSFEPGQIIFSPETPTPRAMTFSPPPMPAASPIAPPQPVAFQDAIPGDLTRRSSNGSQISLTRKNSGTTNQGSNPFEHADDAHYVDLNRSSVTPFQAAQYVEISRRLGSAPPTPRIDVSEEGQAAEADNGASPFGDANVVQEFTVPTIAVVPERARVQSTPPVLPEVIQRPFSPVVISPGPTTGFGSPSAPSHLRVSTQPAYDMDAPKITDFDLPPSAAPTATQFNVGAQSSAEKKRPETIYDEEDAYGGI